MKKNQERRLHRKNAKIAKEGGKLMTLNRPIKPDTTVRLPPRLLLTEDLLDLLAAFFSFSPLILDPCVCMTDMFCHLSRENAATAAKWVT
jgi:hypothetical protein